MKSTGFLRLRWLASRGTFMMAAVVSPHIFAAPLISGEALLTLPVVTAATEPGQFRETRVLKEQSLSLSPGFVWETSTGLSTTQYTQSLPIRTQSARMTTGPSLQLGRFGFALPMQSGYELGIGQAEATWTSNSPRMTFALGSHDQLRLELRVQNRTEQRRALSRKSRKSLGLSWRHLFNDRYSLTAGMGQNQEVAYGGPQQNRGAEVYAQMLARLPDNWQLSLLGSVQAVHYPSGGFGTRATRDRSSSVVLSAERGLGSKWMLSGSLSIDQHGSSGLSIPVYTQSGQLRLTRNF